MKVLEPCGIKEDIEELAVTWLVWGFQLTLC